MTQPLPPAALSSLLRWKKAEWRHGIITPEHSPPAAANQVLPPQQSSNDASASHGAPDGHVRPHTARLLHPRSADSTLTHNSADTTIRPTTTTQAAWLPSAKSAVPSIVISTHTASYRYNLEPSPERDVTPQSWSDNTYDPQLGIFHPDFPAGVVDASLAIHKCSDGPPLWSFDTTYNARDFDLSLGGVISPTAMIGLPCGGTIELARQYPKGHDIPRVRPNEAIAETTGRI